MQHWRIFFFVALIVALGSWFLSRGVITHAPTVVAEAPVRLPEIVVEAPLVLRAPSATSAPPKLTRAARASFALAAGDAYLDPQRPSLKASGHVWNWLSGMVAVPEELARERGLGIQSTARGFALVSASEVPPELESFPLLERADNGLVGVLTGVIVSQSFTPLENVDGLARSCGVVLAQSYPAIKSYLFKVLDKSETEDSITCLRETGLFKRLEWEILSGPRLAQ